MSEISSNGYLDGTTAPATREAQRAPGGGHVCHIASRNIRQLLQGKNAYLHTQTHNIYKHTYVHTYISYTHSTYI